MAVAEKVISHPCQVRIKPVAWCPDVVTHLGEYLNAAQLDGLFELWYTHRVQLWAVMVFDIHVGTIATRIDDMLDGSRQLVLMHCGGRWYGKMAVLDPFFTQQARLNGCHALRLDAGDPQLARIFRKRHNFKSYETSVWRPIEEVSQ